MQERGFTLVELSIVLVILGLLIGGVLTGQSLIHAAELRSVMVDVDQIKAATRTFQDKYFALPGDMPNATLYWGAADSNATTCMTTPGTGTQTCNGTGDGMINNVAAGGNVYETYRFWQHLSNAGMFVGRGSLTPVVASGTNATLPGYNIPSSKITGAGYSVSYSPSNVWYVMPSTNNKNLIVFGAVSAYTWPGTFNYNFGGAITPGDAYNIDKKIDDGVPMSGQVSSGGIEANTISGCTDFPAMANYSVTSTAKTCPLGFVL